VPGYLNPENVLRASIVGRTLFERKKHKDKHAAVVHMTLVPATPWTCRSAANRSAAARKEQVRDDESSDSTW